MFIIILTVLATALAADRIRLAYLVHDLEEDLDRSQGEAISLWSCIKARDKQIFKLTEELSQPRKLG